MSAAVHDPRKVVLVNGFSSLVTIGLRITVLVWVNQHLVRRISAEEYGLFPLVNSLVVFAEFFKNIFTGGLGRFIVEEDARGNHEGVTRVVSSMLPFLGVAALVVAGVSGAAIWNINSVLEIAPGQVGDARLMLGLLVLMLLVGMLSGPFNVGPYAKQRFVLLNAVSLGEEALRVVILLCLLFGVSTRVLWLVIASVVAAMVRTLVLWVVTRRMLPAVRFVRAHVDLGTARRMMSYGAWTSVQGVTNLMANTVPFLLLNRFATAMDVASFHLGRLPDVQLRRVALAAIAPIQPALTCQFARRGEAAMLASYLRGGRYHLWLTLVGIAPFIGFAHVIATLYAGERYHGVGWVMMAMLAGYPVIWASAMFYRVAHAIGRVRKYYLCDIAVQGVALLALVLAIGPCGFGAAGAALAMTLTQVLMHFVLIWPMGLRLVGGSWRGFFRVTVLPGVAPFAAALGVCLAFGQLVAVDDWWSLGAAASCALLAYLGVLFGFCLDRSDRELLASLRAGVVRRLRPARRRAVVAR